MALGLVLNFEAYKRGKIMNNLQIIQTSKPIFAISESADPWHKLFSSLYLAEGAAATQADFLAKKYKASGNQDLYKFYDNMADEERHHAELVKNIIFEFHLPPQTSMDIYSAKRLRCDGNANILERAAIIHIAFEPAALAFMSYIYSRANELFENRWAATIRKSFLAILADEANHAKIGRQIIKDQLISINYEDCQKIKKSLYTHRAFLVGGIRKYFKNYDDQAQISEDLIERYNFSFYQSIRGLF